MRLSLQHIVLLVVLFIGTDCLSYGQEFSAIEKSLLVNKTNQLLEDCQKYSEFNEDGSNISEQYINKFYSLFSSIDKTYIYNDIDPEGLMEERITVAEYVFVLKRWFPTGLDVKLSWNIILLSDPVLLPEQENKYTSYILVEKKSIGIYQSKKIHNTINSLFFVFEFTKDNTGLHNFRISSVQKERPVTVTVAQITKTVPVKEEAKVEPKEEKTETTTKEETKPEPDKEETKTAPVKEEVKAEPEKDKAETTTVKEEKKPEPKKEETEPKKEKDKTTTEKKEKKPKPEKKKKAPKPKGVTKKLKYTLHASPLYTQLNSQTMIDNEYWNLKSKFGYSVGLGISYSIANSLHLETGLCLDEYNAVFEMEDFDNFGVNNILMTDADNDQYYRYIQSTGVKEKNKVRFISLPIIMNYKSGIEGKTGFYVSLGLQLSYALSATYELEGTSTHQGYYPDYHVILYDLEEYDFTNNEPLNESGSWDINTFNQSLYFSAGIELPVTNKSSLSIGPVIFFGISDLKYETSKHRDDFIITSGNQAPGNMATRAFGIEIKWKY